MTRDHSANLVVLVERLIAGTLNDRIEWKTTSSEVLFVANLPSGTIHISQEPSAFEEEVEGGAYDYRIKIYKDGQILEEFTDITLNEKLRAESASLTPGSVFKTMRHLYESARSNALGTTKVVADLLKDLDF